MIKINDEVKAFGGWSTNVAVAKVSSYTYNKGLEVKYNTLPLIMTEGGTNVHENEKTSIKITLQLFKSVEDYDAGESPFSAKDYNFLPTYFELTLPNDFELTLENVEAKVVEHLRQLGRDVEVILTPENIEEE